MPETGQTNQKTGYYKTVCCGKESVLLEGIAFPDCPNHPGMTTIWEPIVDGNTVTTGKPRSSDSLTPRFHVGDQVIYVGVGAHKSSHRSVVGVIEGSLDHIHRYQVRLPDGKRVRCFGFELEPVCKESKAA